MNYSLQRQINIITTFIFFVILFFTFLFGARVIQSYFNQYKNSQSTWLQIYSSSILDEIKMGRIAAVNKQMNFLITQGYFDKINLNCGRINITYSRENNNLGFANSFFNKILFSSSDFKVSVQIKDVENTKWGVIVADLNPDKLLSRIFNDLIVFTFTALGVVLISFGLIVFGTEKLVRPLVKLTDSVRAKIHVKLPDIENEISQLEKAFELYEQEIISNRKLIESQSRIFAFNELAKQVSHDIRSPLSALSMSLSGLSSMPEDRRILIRNAVHRINDIANSLLLKSKQGLQEISFSQNSVLSIEQLAPLLDSLISEKRIQFRDKSNVDIQVCLDKSYGLFANLNANDFKRVISNLINNSVEAAKPNSKLQVKISIESSNDKINILLQDNGKGIPEGLLKKLGNVNISSGKSGSDSGNGLGLMHAKQTILSFSGDLRIESKVGQGTLIVIELPRAQTPAWFVKKIILSPNAKLVSFDDDQSIHQIWTGRLSSLKAGAYGIEHLSFSNTELFRQEAVELLQHNTLFLVDYEVSLEGPTGLDVIEDIAKINSQIFSKTILVTSRYEESNIRNRCTSLGIKMIPKAMAGYVPIEIVQEKEKVDAILLDDDLLVHSVWQMYAGENKRKLLTFTNEIDLQSYLPKCDKSVKLFIDSNLGSNSKKGEDIILFLHQSGFENTFLCTGYEADQFDHLSYIKNVVDKTPNF